MFVFKIAGILCIAEKEFFLSHYRNLTVSLLRLRLDKNACLVALSSLQCLLHTYLHKNASRKETTIHFLEQVSQTLLLEGVEAEVQMVMSSMVAGGGISKAGLTPHNIDEASQSGASLVFWSVLSSPGPTSGVSTASSGMNSTASSWSRLLSDLSERITGQRRRLALLAEPDTVADVLLSIIVTVATVRVEFALSHMIAPLLSRSPRLSSPWLRLGLRALALVCHGGSAWQGLTGSSLHVDDSNLRSNDVLPDDQLHQMVKDMVDQAQQQMGESADGVDSDDTEGNQLHAPSGLRQQTLSADVDLDVWSSWSWGVSMAHNSMGSSVTSSGVPAAAAWSERTFDHLKPYYRMQASANTRINRGGEGFLPPDVLLDHTCKELSPLSRMLETSTSVPPAACDELLAPFALDLRRILKVCVDAFFRGAPADSTHFHAPTGNLEPFGLTI